MKKNKKRTLLIMTSIILLAIIITLIIGKLMLGVIISGIITIIGTEIVRIVVKFDKGEKVYIDDIRNSKDCFKMSIHSKSAIIILLLGIIFAILGIVIISLLGNEESNLKTLMSLLTIVGLLMIIVSMICVPKCLELEEDKRLTISEINKIENMLKEKGIITIEQMDQYSKILQNQSETKNKYGKINNIYITVIFLPFVDFLYHSYIENTDISSVEKNIIVMGVVAVAIDWIIMLYKIFTKYNDTSDEKIITAIEQIKLKRMLEESNS